MRLSVRKMLALVAVLTVPVAFWGWRLRTGVPFPAGLDVATIAVTIGSAGVIAEMTGWRRNRLFGGCLWGECFIGIHRLSDPPWYPPCARDAIRSWATRDPNFIRNFRERALEGRDRGYVRNLVSRIHDACPADQLPASRYPEYQRAAGPDSHPSDVRNQ
jgi:hypothetical protein